MLEGEIMANSIERSISKALLQYFNQETIILVSTVNAENQSPNMNAISWFTALDEETVRFAVDQRSWIVSNIEKNSFVSCSLFANETIYCITGKATILSSQLPGIPLKLACIEVKVSEVKNIMFYGSKISVEPGYVKTYDEKAAKKLDDSVLKALRTYTID
jgi:hypothetical protein